MEDKLPPECEGIKLLVNELKKEGFYIHKVDYGGGRCVVIFQHPEIFQRNPRIRVYSWVEYNINRGVYTMHLQKYIGEKVKLDFPSVELTIKREDDQYLADIYFYRIERPIVVWTLIDKFYKEERSEKE